MIVENMEVIRQRVATACKKAGRDTREIQILLATKTVTADRIREAILAGYLLIGENKVQEIKQKFEDLQDLKPVQHFIGHLQTNKIKELLKYKVSCIQSVDRFELALKLHQRLIAENKSLEILVQVNTSGEASKFGVAPEQAAALTQQISTLSSLHIKGLMTIGLFSNNREKIRHCFSRLKSLQQEISLLNIPNVEMKELSMGMSGDLEIAIEEGATIIRVGTAIFGKRNYPDSYYWNESASVS